MNIGTNSTVGRIAAEHPAATKVFGRHGIDFCCGGGRPLDEACRERGLDAAAIVVEIEHELSEVDAPDVRWDLEPVDALIEHILTKYHASLREELPRLEGMARKVLDAHGAENPETLPELLSTFLGLRAELEQHMAKEEQILFPMIRNGQGAMAGGPVSVMEHEHDNAGHALARLRELTDGYRVPEQACNTWRALWHGLETLEKDLHQHIHLENNILFPRALDG